MNLSAVYHEAKSRYAYAFDTKTLHLRLRTARDDVASVTLVGGDPFRWIQSQEDPNHWEWDKTAAFFQPMRLEYRTALHDYWFTAVQPQWGRLRYGFVLESGAEKYLFGGRACYDLNQNPGLAYETSLYFNFPYINHEDIYAPPDWVRETVWYQIFPDRYADGDPTNNPPGALPWGSPGHSNIFNHLGGDLQGIINHLDELQELGITGIYLTPIFEAPSSHKYDTSNYYKIDPAFGTNELFGKMVAEAHARGIRIMLDAVFNHAGWFHPFWQDVVQNGRGSKYADCFFLTGDPVINFPVIPGKLPRLTPDQVANLHYRTFAFAASMPKWNTDHPLVKEHLLGAIRYWTETYHVDGWRLDVSNEVSHDFWREFRKLARSINPQVYILGENWDNSAPWLMGDQFDGVMNYEYTYAIWNLLGSGQRPGGPFNVLQFQQAVSQYLANNPKHVTPNMYNLVDSHDTGRILHICGEDPARARLAFALMFVFTGAPSIYYGSEIGLGGDGSHNRAPMPWDSASHDLELRAFVKKLIQLRRDNPTLRVVDMDWLDTQVHTNTMIIKKSAPGFSPSYLFVNASAQPQQMAMPAELTGRRLLDLLTGRWLEPADGVSLPPFGFMLAEGAV